jgi:hypothetical protein
MVVNNNEFVGMLKPSENIINAGLKGVIFCCEVDPILLKEDYHNFPMQLKQNGEVISYPRMLTITNKMTLKDLKIKFYAFGRRYIDLPEKLNTEIGQKFEDFLENFSKSNDLNYESYLKIIEEEFDNIFGVNTKSEEIKNFIKNLPFEAYLIDFKTNKKIPILSAESEMNGITEQLNELSLNEGSSTIIDLIKKGYKIVFEFKNTNYINEMKFKNIKTCMSIAVKEKTKQLNLEDCLEHFRLTEKLEKNNEWYCSNCKKHQQAFKKLELFSTPPVLILHLKRFEYSQMGRYRTYAEKIGLTIDFPLNDLDMSNHIIGPEGKVVYELYAVSQHYGSTGGGHYTAICKNYNKWYDFNDSSVSPSSENNVVTGAAYLLFYRRKYQD